MQNTLKIGIVGCGAIGTILAKAIDKGIKKARVVALDDIIEKNARTLKSNLSSDPEISSLDNLIERSDLVIECAHKTAVKEIVSKTLERKKDILVMSVSGLVENPYLLELAQKNKCSIYVPSGAVAGIDALKAAKLNNIRSVTLTTTKPKEGLKGAPYIKEKNIDLDSIKNRTVIFDGNVLEAIKGFPSNVNVSATLALAGIGPEKTRVKVVVDPASKSNIHEIEITGDFGTITTRTENAPCPSNPKTSYIAALSAIAKIKDITECINIGT